MSPFSILLWTFSIGVICASALIGCSSAKKNERAKAKPPSGKPAAPNPPQSTGHSSAAASSVPLNPAKGNENELETTQQGSETNREANEAPKPEKPKNEPTMVLTLRNDDVGNDEEAL